MRTKIFFLLCITSISLFGCAPKYLDIQAKVTRREVALPEYNFYQYVVWLSDDLIAFVYYPKDQIPFVPNRLSIYNVFAKKIIDVPMPARSSSCEFNWWPGPIAISPNGNLAFVAECRPLGSYQLLMEYDLKTRELKQLFDYSYMFATHFSFISPDRVIQEDAVGSPMSNELWMISVVSQTKNQILADFLRAAQPTWSAQEKLIAFWGTEKFPSNEPKDLYTLKDISNLVRYPWDLYVMDENAGHIRKVFPLVASARGLEWSPTNNLLAFGGTIDDVEGIWLIDVNNPKPIRIFDHSWLFTWSPDGKKIIAIETKFPDEKNNTVPVKAYILELPNCVFENSCR